MWIRAEQMLKETERNREGLQHNIAGGGAGTEPTNLIWGEATARGKNSRVRTSWSPSALV